MCWQFNQLLPSTGGSWLSSNAAVATINASGMIYGIAPGNVQFTFTNSSTGCVSNASTTISVGPSLSAAINYNGNICLTDTSKLSLITTAEHQIIPIRGPVLYHLQEIHQ
ncbi:MAG: hypothetical protein IPN49_16480 [Saprospiraceae bacterium]|nr:hypothetical protein [Saprospiraceae bacterium]